MASETQQIAVTDRAFSRIAEILRDEPGAIGLRVSVSGGGCSGFQYGFEIEKETRDDDVKVSQAAVAVIVDEMSLQFLRGSCVDFVDDLIGARFDIKNPNAKSSCGCGTSFSL